MSKKKASKNKPGKSKLKLVEAKLGRRQSLGLWEKVGNGTSTITIDERLRGFQRLLIITHEALHEICPDWTEEKVINVSEFLASILWHCDYRHVDHKGEDKPNYRPPVKRNKKPIVKTYEQKNAKAKKGTNIRNPGANPEVG